MSFAPDRNIVDYNQLFTATAILPSHVIAEELGVDVTAALLGNNAPVIARIAQTWNTTWNLKPGTESGVHQPNTSRRPGRTRSSRYWTVAQWFSSPTTNGGAPSR